MIPAAQCGGLALRSAVRDYLSARWPTKEARKCRTYKDHEHRLTAYAEAVPDVLLSESTAELIADGVQLFLNKEKLRGMGDCTLDNHRRCLSAFYAWAIRSRWVPFKANPCAKTFINCPRPVTRCRQPVGEADLNKLLLATCCTEIYPYILLALACGLRLAGAVRVKRHQVNLDERTLLVFEKSRERIVPLSKWFCSELKTYLEHYPWQSLHYDTVHHRLAEIRKEFSIPDHVTIQALRRTFLKKLLDAGVPVQKAAAIAGNSMEVIQKHYVELETLNARSVVDVLDFGGQGG